MSRLFTLRAASAAFFCFLTAGNLSAQTPNVSATKTDTYVPNSAGRATQGGTIGYTNVISNTGTGTATNVIYTDPTPTNTTLVGGSVNVSPLAVNDSYNVVGNTLLRVGGTAGTDPELYVSGNVLTNDREFLSDTFTLTAITAGASAQGGIVNLAADGTFTYLPPVGFTGTDTFTYTIRDDGTDSIFGNADDLTGTGTVTLTVANKVWYVDSTAGTTGDGRSSLPFDSLADVSGASGADAAGDVIFVRERAGDYNGNLTLLNNQQLIGSGVALVVGGNTLFAAATNTTWTNTGGDAITLASGNTVRGITVGDTTGTDIIGSAVGTLAISNVTLSGGGRAFAVTTSGTLAVTFDSLSATSGTNAVNLTGCNGTLTISAGTINGPTGDDFVVNGGSANISYAGTLTNSAGRSVNISNKTGGTVAFSGLITDTGSGILCDNNDQSGVATVAFTGGLNINTGTNAAFSAINGGNIRVIQNNITVFNTLTTTDATALNISGTTIDALGVTFRSIASNGSTATGIILNSTGSSGGLTVTGLDGVDAGTAPDAGSGGTIANKTSGTDGDPFTGTGIYLNSTNNVSLNGMILNNLGNYGIRGLSVTGFTLAYSTIGGTTGNTVTGHEGAIAFGTSNPSGANGLFGTGLIDNVEISGAIEHQVEFYNQSGTLNLTISNCNIHDNTTTSGSDGIQMEMTGTANATVSINTCTFDDNKSQAVQFSALENSVANVTINGNTLLRSTQGNEGIILQNGGNADLTTTVSNNNISGIGGTSIFVGQVAGNATASSELRATISGNTVIAPASATNHAIIAFLTSTVGQISQARLLIDNNTVTQNSTSGTVRGIIVDTPDATTSPNFHATVTNNKVEVNDNVAGVSGLIVQARQSSTGHIDVRANDVDFDNGTPAGVQGMRVRQVNPATLEMHRGSSTIGTPVATALANNNTLSTTEVLGTVTLTENNVVLLPSAPLMFAPDTDMAAMTVAALPEPEVLTTAAPKASMVSAALPDAEVPGVQETLSQAQLNSLVSAATARWEAAGLSESQMAILRGLNFELTDLPGMHLGNASGSTIKISTRAAGQAWFVDATPADDAEFSRQASATRHTIRAGDTLAADRVDLLTTVMHEMGHALGLADRYELQDRDSVMFGYLARGERRLPALGEAASVAPFQDETQRFLSAPITIGDLPPGKSVTIVYSVTIDTTTAASISSQGQVTGDNFSAVNTNDPDTVAANDATLTGVEQLPTVSDIAVSVNEDNVLTFAATQFDAGFSDLNTLPSQDTLQAIQITSLPSNGTLTKNVTNDAVAINDIITRAGIANLKFTPTASYSGSASFGWKGSDGQGYSVAGALVNITVNEVNDEPTLNAITDPVAILEGAGLQTVNLSGIGAGTGETQTLTVTAVSNNTSLIPNPTVTYTSPDATGSLSYTPVADAFGTAIITVTVQDNGGVLNGGDDTITRTFTVTVTNINDEPTLNAISDPTPILPSAGLQTVNLSGISEGPNESAQTLTITAVSNNTGLIPNPTVNYVEGNSTGTLTYTPVAGNAGTATITVTVQDNGGTDNGGDDTIVRTFDVVVSNFVAVSTSVSVGDNTASESGDTGLFTFTRGLTVGALVADFQLDAGSTAGSAEYTITGAGITFDSGTGAGTVTFPDGVNTVTATLTAIADTVQSAEPSETVTLNVVPQPGVYVAGTSSSATVTILQNGFLVINTNDSGEGSLRQAIENANALGGNPTVTFDATAFATPQVITLASSLSVINSMTVQGPGAALLAISGNDAVRVLVVSGSTSFILRDVTVRNGTANGGGGILSGSTTNLTLDQCVISSNFSASTGAGLLHQGGGGTLTVDRSTFSSNTTGGGTGGAGIESAAATNRITNTTFTGQVSNSSGGGYRSSGSGVASFFTNCTFSGNTAASTGGGAIRILAGIGNLLVLNHCTLTNNRTISGAGGGINVASGVPLLLNDCLVADNYLGNDPSTTRSDISGAVIATSSNNLIGVDTNLSGITNGTNGNTIGTAAVPLDPLLGALSDNGGPTQTHALLGGSPAINAGAVVSESQSVFLTANTGGTFTLTFNGQTTGSLAGTSTGAVVQAALTSLSSVGVGNAVVQQIGTRYVVTFTGTLAGTDQPALTSSTAGGLTVTVSTLAEGGLPAYDQRGTGFVRATGVVDIGAFEVQRGFSVVADTVSANEGTGGTSTAFNFTVSRSGSTVGAVTVDYTVTGSGVNPANAADFGGSFPSGTVTIADGESSAPVTVINVSHDSLVEYNETFDVVLSNPAATYIIASGTATATITNDDTATVTIEKINNGAEIAVPIDGLFRVTQSALSSSNTVLSYSVAGTATPGTDYTTLSGTVTILAGELTADIVVDVLVDADASENLETVIATLTAVTGGNPAVTLGSPSSATVDITSTPVPISSPLGDVVTENGAPGTDGTTSIGDFDILRRGAFLAENSDLVFPGSLIVSAGPPTVTTENSQGIWKGTGGSLLLIARTGTVVPDIAGTEFDYLPIVPAISDEGEVTILASLRIGIGGVNVDNDTGIWSELGGGGLSLVIREGDAVPGLSGVQVGRLASGAYATATTGATTGEAAFSVIFKGASTDTAILRTSISGSAVTVQVVARENSAAPGTALQFGNIAGNYSDPARMDASGNLAFAALTKPGNKEGIWYQPVGGSLVKVFAADNTAPGTGGATFNKLQRPSMGSNGRIAFRAFLNANGDNSANLKNDGIWFGDAANPASFTCILRRGDTNATVTGLTATQKVGNVWGGWLSNGNLGAWKGWVDMDGNGTSAAPTDVHGIYANTSGTMELIVKAGDAAPGVSGATFTGFDLPLVGGQEQSAFLGTITGVGVTSANNQGLWREGANGGALTLLLRTGDSISTTQGSKTVQAIDFPGSGQTDRRWEQPVMDANGRILMNVIFTDGSSSQLISP